MVVNPKIKIAHVITRMDWGGSPDIVRILFTFLDVDKFDVWLVIGETKHPSAKTAEFLEKFKDKTILIPQLKRDIEPFNDFWAFVRLCLLFQRHRFDIVHTHTAKAGFLGRIAAKLAGVRKVIHTPHGHNFYGYFNPWASKIVVVLEKFADYFTDKIIVLTELEKRDLIDYGVSNKEKITVVHSGLEIEVYAKVKVDIQEKKKELTIENMDESIVAMIGRLEPVKGPEYFVEAAKLVLEKVSSVKFLIIGDGSLREKLVGATLVVAQNNAAAPDDRATTRGDDRATTRVAPTGKFIFLGWRDDIPELLQIIDIVVLPSLNEAVGRILLESGLCGVPVIATNVGGVAEVVKDGISGILVQSKDAQTLAKAILTLVQDKEKRTTMGKAAKEWVQDNFSAEKMSSEVVRAYISSSMPGTEIGTRRW